ncbi:hypothetical protein CE91St36_23560 [Christensenellaceae bacterium]|nr:hypothetical protein CE91St36_23560 [Christensenellaceae bacterium]
MPKDQRSSEHNGQRVVWGGADRAAQACCVTEDKISYSTAGKTLSDFSKAFSYAESGCSPYKKMREYGILKT